MGSATRVLRTLLGCLFFVTGLAGLLLVYGPIVHRTPVGPERLLALDSRLEPLVKRLLLPAPPAAQPESGPGSTDEPIVPEAVQLPAEPARVAEPAAERGELLPPTPSAVLPAPQPAPPAVADPAPRQMFGLPITKLLAPRTRLEANVVLSRLVELEGDVTWEVPAFNVGHGERSAGAGEAGNAVLVGHVTSTNAGSVFKDLHRLRTGDLVQVFSHQRAFDYQVVDVRSVPRTDLSVLQPTDSASVSLITCTGVWLPAIRDYSERLVVRAELVSPPPG